MRAALVVCPASGLGTAARVAGTVSAALRDSVDHLGQHVPTSADETVAVLRSLVADGTDAVVVLGGDGAAHAGVQACAGTQTTLAIVPAGTGNDLARALGLPPKDPIAAVTEVAQALAEGRTHRIDLGKVEDGAWFATVLCAGFDSAVNERVNRTRWPRGPRRYDIAILAELAALKSARLIVRTESETLELAANSVAVGNTPYYGGGIPVCPDADPADGWFDVTVVGQAHRRDLVRILPGLRTGSHVDHPAVTTLRAKSISLAADGGWIGYADGERIRELPLDVRCVPGALRVVPGRSSQLRGLDQ
ncbi:diacylglycerol kinase family protein [Kibdelosporangium persicum]|uniref:Diacylglycerol kinase catalytic region n=1 Tax=Kibdelosporangium persicum TaxID=2698649 RepID=A0ABX2F819_9PSEU|nr:YegS/Rv2252/BmrU family lipid kinase [Kibdelosporangium persicum]NRN67495.1 Diacylglycerol kinase catalytic region [Kibdelosporangium persicum]